MEHSAAVAMNVIGEPSGVIRRMLRTGPYGAGAPGRSIGARVLADGDDAARDDDVQAEATRLGDELVALGPRIEPHFFRLLAGDVVDQFQAYFRRHVEADAIERHRDVEDRGVCLEALDLRGAGIDGV